MSSTEEFDILDNTFVCFLGPRVTWTAAIPLLCLSGMNQQPVNAYLAERQETWGDSKPGSVQRLDEVYFSKCQTLPVKLHLGSIVAV